MRGGSRWLGASLWLGASACAFDSTGDGGTPQDSVGNDATSDDDDDAAGSMSTTSAESTATATTSATQGSGPDDGSDATSVDPQTDTGSPSMPGCPDPLPEEWVFCIDFDDANDVEAFSTWEPSGDRLTVVEGSGRESTGGLQFTYGPGSGWTGRATLNFGDSPDETEYEGPRVTEVYVRLYMRTQAAWPSVAAGDLLGLSVRDVPGMPSDTAVDVSVVSNTGELGLVARPNRCFTDGMPGCGALTYLEPTGGTTPVYSQDLSDAWQCVELHVGLEQKGGDGLIEQHVDGVQDGRRTNYTFVEDWDERGWNAFRLSGSWPGDVPEPPLQRWVDDLVISTAPIGCD